MPIYALTLQNEPQNRNPNALPGHRHAGRARRRSSIEALGPSSQRAGLRTKILGYDHNWSEHPNDVASDAARRGPRDRVPVPTCSAPRRRAGSPGSRSTATPATPRARPSSTTPSRSKGVWFTECSGLARPDRPAGAGLLRHAEVAHPQPRARRHPQLGQDRRQLEPRARPDRRPAQRRLRHLHRRASPSARADRHPRTPSTTRSATSRGSCSPARDADREHVVRHHRLERADHGRRVPQPATARPRWSSHNENDDPRDVRRRAGRRVVRLHAARRRARDVRVDGAARRRLPRCSIPPSGPAEAVDDDATTTWSGSELNLDLGRTQRVRRVVVDAGTAAPPGPATLTIGGKTWTADGGRPAHDLRHPGDAGAVPADRLQRDPRRSRTCGSTAEEVVHDQARADSAA